MKILIVLHHRFELWKAPRWFSERLRAEFPHIEVVHLENYSGAEQHLPDTDIALTWSLRPEQLNAAPRLKWIHSPAAAVHQLMIPEIVNSPIIVTNASRVNGPPVAEHVIALLLAMAKRLPEAVRLQEKHIWGQQNLWDERPRPREVTGATLGLVGVGSIGTEVGKRAHALGMKIIAIREHPERKTEFPAHVLGPERMEEVLPECDYVVLCAPLTPKTRELFNAERLALMKPEACLINVARGPLVDDAALAAALLEKRLGGAALDVFEKEPLGADSPLWDTPGVLITPHSAALTEKNWERQYAFFTENLRRFEAGQELLSVVDKRKGY